MKYRSTKQLRVAAELAGNKATNSWNHRENRDK
jgi:hypothetical protein